MKILGNNDPLNIINLADFDGQGKIARQKLAPGFPQHVHNVGQPEDMPEMNDGPFENNVGNGVKAKIDIFNAAQPFPFGQPLQAWKDGKLKKGLGKVRAEDLDVDPSVFTLADLRKICHGDYNVGELMLKKDGTLKKINNHVGGRCLENNVKLTPEQNLAVRRQVCECLMDRYGHNPRIDKVKELLLNERDRTSSLSRDEVKFLFRMLEAGEGGGYTVDNYLKLHDFKVGKLTDVTQVAGFVTGLATADRAQDGNGVKKIVKAVSVNAQQSIVSHILNEIRRFLSRLFAGPGTEISTAQVDKSLWGLENGQQEVKENEENYPDDFYEEQTVGKWYIGDMLKGYQEHYQMPAALKLKKNTVGTDQFYENCKRDLCMKIRKRLAKEQLASCVLENKEKAETLLMRVSDRITQQQWEAFADIDYADLGKRFGISTRKAESLWLEDFSLSGSRLTAVFKPVFGDEVYKLTVDGNGKKKARVKMVEGQKV